MSRRRSDPPTPCGKKRLSASKAKGVVEKARRSRNPNRLEQRVYFCTGCDCWHTSKEPFLTFEQRRAARA